jgi:hypothetical protein
LARLGIHGRRLGRRLSGVDLSRPYWANRAARDPFRPPTAHHSRQRTVSRSPSAVGSAATVSVTNRVSDDARHFKDGAPR